LFWTLCAFVLVRAANRGWVGTWYWLGLAAGLAWLNKYSIGFWGLALLLGIARDPGYVFYRHGPRMNLDSVLMVRIRDAKRFFGEIA